MENRVNLSLSRPSAAIRGHKRSEFPTKQSFAGLTKPTTPFRRWLEEALWLSKKYEGPKTYTKVIAANEAAPA